MGKYKCGLILGRFQPIHKGHLSLMLFALSRCEKIIVAIGSAQASRTERNPLSYEERRDMIDNALAMIDCQDKAIIIPIKDREVYSDDASFGEYLMNEISKQGVMLPDVIIEGQEVVRSTWYETLDIDLLQIDRGCIPVSASAMRKAMLENDKEFLKEYGVVGIDNYYELTGEILTCLNQSL
jgi:nicotinamide-nucleotide adenylyltransferase